MSLSDCINSSLPWWAKMREEILSEIRREKLKGFIKKENNEQQKPLSFGCLHCVQIIFFNVLGSLLSFPLAVCYVLVALRPLLLVSLSLSLFLSFSFSFFSPLLFYLQKYAIKNSVSQQQKALSSLACALISLFYLLFFVLFVCLFVLLLSLLSSVYQLTSQ
jgi:hypothetical protein